MADTVKHTKGPWAVKNGKGWPWNIKIMPHVVDMDRAAYSTLARTLEDVRNGVGFPITERDEAIKAVAIQEADARLIAAAPELLEALKGLLAEVDRSDVRLSSLIYEAETAIAKAEGSV